MIGGRRKRRSLWIGVFLLAAAAVIAVGLSHAGRVFLVRSYLRVDRVWSRDFPIDGAKGVVRALEPVLVRFGLLRPVRVEVEPGVSLLLDPEDDISRTILISMGSKWEPEVWASILSGLSPGAVFFDVGAHIGYDSLKASRLVGENGRVVAFEPNPNTVTLLRANVDASGAKNVIVEPFACSDKEQTLTLYDSTLSGNSGASSLSARNAGVKARPYKVLARRIDDIVSELGLARVDAMKVDVEGAELYVLRGAAGTLNRFHPRLILEVVPRQLENLNTSVEDLHSFLRSHGYQRMRNIDYKNQEWTRR